MPAHYRFVCGVCSVSLYGAEIRTTLKADERKIELSGFREKTLKISWADKIRNEDTCGVGRMKSRVDTENGEKKSGWNI